MNLPREIIMTVKNDITNQNELEFAIFCIENIAIKLGIKANSVYKALTDKSNFLFEIESFLTFISFKNLYENKICK